MKSAPSIARPVQSTGRTWSAPRFVAPATLCVSIGALTLLSSRLLAVAYDPDFSRARREELVDQVLPLWILLAVFGAAVSTSLGIRRRGLRAHLLGDGGSLLARSLRVVGLSMCLGAVTPAVQRALGGEVSIHLSQNLFGSPAAAALAVVGVLAMAAQEESVVRASTFELSRLLPTDRILGVRVARNVVAVVAVALVVGLTHLGSGGRPSGVSPFIYALLPRLIPTLAILWIYSRKGLLEACALHGGMNLCAFALIPIALDGNS